MNKKLVIANWKMNLNMQESSIFLHKLSEKVQAHRGMEVILAPSTFTLQSLSLQINHRQFKLAAQNFYKDIRAKVAAAIRNNIRPILCIGETSDERNHDETNLVLNDQLLGGLANVSSEDISKVIIAYEPVWAIGTGVNANPDDIRKAVKTIRNQIKNLYGAKTAEEIQVVYGGSVQPEFATDYAKIKGVDGLLIGGASLSVEKFAQITQKVFETIK